MFFLVAILIMLSVYVAKNEKIAEKYNTTPEEVRREMQIAIDAGFDNPDPAVQEEWKKMTLKGDRPTPEEVINYAVKN